MTRKRTVLLTITLIAGILSWVACSDVLAFSQRKTVTVDWNAELQKAKAGIQRSRILPFGITKPVLPMTHWATQDTP